MAYNFPKRESSKSILSSEMCEPLIHIPEQKPVEDHGKGEESEAEEEKLKKRLQLGNINAPRKSKFKRSSSVQQIVPFRLVNQDNRDVIEK